MNSKDGVRLPIIPMMNQENQLLDLKKSQNIAILLRALQITSDEVCEALLEGKDFRYYIYIYITYYVIIIKRFQILIFFKFGKDCRVE